MEPSIRYNKLSSSPFNQHPLLRTHNFSNGPTHWQEHVIFNKKLKKPKPRHEKSIQPKYNAN